MSSNNNQIVILPNSFRTLVMGIGCISIVFLSVSAEIINQRLPFHYNLILSSLLYQIAAIFISIIFFGAGGVYLLYVTFVPKPVLILNSAGIRVGRSGQYIPWEQINSFTILIKSSKRGRLFSLQILVRDGSLLPKSKLQSWLFNLFHLPLNQITIPQAILSTPISKILDDTNHIFQEEIRKYNIKINDRT